MHIESEAADAVFFFQPWGRAKIHQLVSIGKKPLFLDLSDRLHAGVKMVGVKEFNALRGIYGKKQWGVSLFRLISALIYLSVILSLEF